MYIVSHVGLKKVPKKVFFFCFCPPELLPSVVEKKIKKQKAFGRRKKKKKTNKTKLTATVRTKVREEGNQDRIVKTIVLILVLSLESNTIVYRHCSWSTVDAPRWSQQ